MTFTIGTLGRTSNPELWPLIPNLPKLRYQLTKIGHNSVTYLLRSLA